MDSAQPGDELPTYDSLAANNTAPNSRFGRWRGWVEKRALERHADTSLEEDDHTLRGWGPSASPALERDVPISTMESAQTEHLNRGFTRAQPPQYSSPGQPVSQGSFSRGHRIPASHASIHDFGSRFIGHATAPINALLPIMSDRFLLIGTTEGLSVLDVLPGMHGGPAQVTAGVGTGLADAKPRVIWRGEPVWQLALLESTTPPDTDGDGQPQGVVLALVGSKKDDHDAESHRSVRMYNLASLSSLVMFAVTHPDAAILDLSCTPDRASQGIPSKRHRPQNSLARGLLSLIIDHPEPSCAPGAPTDKKRSSILYPIKSRSTPSPPKSASPSLDRADTFERENAWDVVDDLPLRWATDYVPLAPSNTRIAGLDIISFELWKRETYDGRVGNALLAVAAKSSILLYEAPKGERAFRYVKELYTPFPARNMNFAFQEYHEAVVSRHSLQSSHTRHSHHSRHASTASTKSYKATTREVQTSSTFGAQHSLFVTFEKRAGFIRLSDSAVSEAELWEEKTPISSTDEFAPPRRSTSFEKLSPTSSGIWLPLSHITLPGLPESTSSTMSLATILNALSAVCLLTKGKHTHVVQSPLPAPLSSKSPLMIFTWRTQPTHVAPRICYPEHDRSARLQVVGFSSEGVEVLEVSVAALRASAAASAADAKGKGKARDSHPMLEPERGFLDIGADTGFLAYGGRWHAYSDGRSGPPRPKRQDSSESLNMPWLDTQGLYAFARRGGDDWRVFYVGDHMTGDASEDGD